LSLGNHKPYGNILLMILFRGSCGSEFCHKWGGKGFGYSGIDHNK
jgi:hypothetical protein